MLFPYWIVILGFNKITGCSDCREGRSDNRKVSEETVTKFSQGDGGLDRVVAGEVVRGGWILDVFCKELTGIESDCMVLDLSS